MIIGLAIVCAETAGSLEQLQGRSVLGHCLDRARRALPSLPVMIVAPEASEDLGTYCTRALLPYRQDGLIDAVRQTGWDAVICLDADQIFTDHNALQIALGLMRTGQFELVTTNGNKAHPKGTGVTAFRTTAFDGTETAWPRPTDLPGLAAAYTGTGAYVMPFEGGTPAPELDLRAGADRALTKALLEFADADPAGIPLDRLIAAARHNTRVSPWKGDSGPLLIAEIGGNHEGNFDVAKAMAASALRSGADCVKFQLYTGKTLVSPVESPVRHRHFQKFELTREQHIYLAEMCREAGVSYVSSVWD